MATKKPVRISCPGCRKKNIQSHVAARRHFMKACHSPRCSACQRTFNDALGTIQHYQTCNKANGSSPNVPSTSVPSTSVPSTSVPSTSVPSTSVPSTSVPSTSVPSTSVPSTSVPSTSVPSPSAMVITALRSRGVQTNTPEEALKVPEQEIEILYDAMNKFLVSMPITNLEAGHTQEALLGAISENPPLPIVLSTLEQHLILRYLRSRCHSWNRLQAQGYILGSDSMSESNKNKKHAHKASIQRREFRDAPHMVLPGAGRISAIAIDCEMVGVRGGRQTLAFLTAINFLTGEVLINRYVNPVEDVVDWRSKFSGVTQKIMADAVACGEAFGSWREARDKLWEFMDKSTVLVGHSLNYDLEVLGIFHAKVVDSAILTSETVYPHIISTRQLPRQWGLKTLAKEFLSLAIQSSNCGHSALEDTYAARDIVIWCIMNPEKLKSWAENARRQEEERKMAQRRQAQGKRRSKGNALGIRSTQNWGNSSGRDNYSEDIHWSDFAEELGWPAEYDPWSD